MMFVDLTIKLIDSSSRSWIDRKSNGTNNMNVNNTDLQYRPTMADLSWHLRSVENQ